MPMNFFTPQTIRNIWGEWGRTPPEPGRQGKRQMPRTRWHPARILPDAPGGVLRGVGAAGGCGTRGISKRAESPPNRYRSDSSGMLYAFPIQRSSGSVRVALHLPCPEGFLPVKNFQPCPQMPAAPTPRRTPPGASGRMRAECQRVRGVCRCPWRPGSGGVLVDASVRKGSGTE